MIFAVSLMRRDDPVAAPPRWPRHELELRFGHPHVHHPAVVRRRLANDEVKVSEAHRELSRGRRPSLDGHERAAGCLQDGVLPRIQEAADPADGPGAIVWL